MHRRRMALVIGRLRIPLAVSHGRMEVTRSRFGTPEFRELKIISPLLGLWFLLMFGPGLCVGPFMSWHILVPAMIASIIGMTFLAVPLIEYSRGDFWITALFVEVALLLAITMISIVAGAILSVQTMEPKYGLAFVFATPFYVLSYRMAYLLKVIIYGRKNESR